MLKNIPQELIALTKTYVPLPKETNVVAPEISHTITWPDGDVIKYTICDGSGKIEVITSCTGEAIKQEFSPEKYREYLVNWIVGVVDSSSKTTSARIVLEMIIWLTENMK